VLLAAAATVIASQAMISGAFSIARQCVQLGFLPRLSVRHTSGTEEGQIYLPQVNFALLFGVLVLVFAFRDSESLAAAYGIAVTGTFICGTALAVVVFRRKFGWSRGLVALVFGPLLALDLLFFSSNALKVPEGGWMPLALGAGLFVLMTTWHRGHDLLFERVRHDGLPLMAFLARLPQSRTVRVPGTAVFMTGGTDYVPNALLHNLKHNKVLHERVLFVTVLNEGIPEVPDERRLEAAGTRARRPPRGAPLRLPREPRRAARSGDAAPRRGWRGTPCRPATSWAGRRWCGRRCPSCPAGGSGSTG
jgi:KUP system potassium uptake protein